jgi:hypothetical protein
MFVIDEQAPITVDMFEKSPDGYAKLLQFRDRILAGNVCKAFTSPSDLAQHVFAVLKQLES